MTAASLYDGCPWLFERQATGEERRDQRAFRNALEATGRFRLGAGGYLSPKAYWAAEQAELGDGCLIAAGVRVDGTLKAGRGCSLNLNATVAGRVTMGDDVRIGTCAGIWGFDHAHDDPEAPIAAQGITSRGVEIGDGVWIGANATVTDGVRIGRNVIVAAGAVVTRDVPDYALVAGNPARVVRDRRTPREDARDRLRSALLRLSDKAARDWRTVLARHRSDARAGHVYSDPRNDADDPVRPDCDAIQIAAMFGAVPDGRETSDWVRHLAARQDPGSGLFVRDPGALPPTADDVAPGNAHLYDILCVTYALECMGARPKHRIRWADRALEQIGARLDALPWHDRGWHCGAVVDAIGTAAYVNARYFGGQPGLGTLFGELLLRCDATTGMWSAPDGEDWLQPVNGFYRLTRGTHAQFGLPLPHPEAAIDTVLRHAARNGNFRSRTRNACNVLDVVHPLMLCTRQSPHRSAEVSATILAATGEIERQWQDGAGIAFAADEPTSLQGTEMWLSIAALTATHFGFAEELGFRLSGIHRFEPALAGNTLAGASLVPADA